MSDNSDLYKMSRLASSDHFPLRVQAAMIRHARSLVSGADGNNKWLAIWVLLNPTAIEPSMLALCAGNNDVLKAATMVNELVNDDPITDAQITTAVTENWPIVAAKYPANPLARQQVNNGPVA